MLCPTCETECYYICPNCYESTSSKWHSSEDAKKFKKELIKFKKKEDKNDQLEN